MSTDWRWMTPGPADVGNSASAIVRPQQFDRQCTQLTMEVSAPDAAQFDLVDSSGTPVQTLIIPPTGGTLIGTPINRAADYYEVRAQSLTVGVPVRVFAKVIGTRG